MKAESAEASSASCAQADVDRVPHDSAGIGVFHAFKYPNGYALIDGDRVSVRRIDSETFEWLNGLGLHSPLGMTPAVVQRLETLGLRAEIDPNINENSGAGVPVRTVALLITQKCNFRCTYCYGDGGSYGDGGVMSRDTAFHTIDWLIGQSGNEKKLTVTFFGGEPFLNFKRMKEVVAYAREQGEKHGKEFGFSVTTNGSLLNDEHLAFIKENNIVTVVSLDGPKEINDRQRPSTKGEGTFDNTVRNVKRLLEVFPDTPVRATLVGDTDPALVEASLREVGFNRINLTGASRSTFDNGVGSSADSFGKLYERSEAIARDFLSATQARDLVRVEALVRAGGGRSMRKMIEQFLNHHKRDFFCGAGRYYAGVSAAGDIYACHRLVGTEDHRIGSVFEGKLSREIYEKNGAIASEECTHCFGKYVCAGGCYHDNIGETGSAFKPSREMCGKILSLIELAAAVSIELTDEDKQFLATEKVITLAACPLDMFD